MKLEGTWRFHPTDPGGEAASLAWGLAAGVWAGPASGRHALSPLWAPMLSQGWDGNRSNLEGPGVSLDVTHLPEATQRVPVASMGPAGGHGKQDQGTATRFPLLTRVGSPKYVTPLFLTLPCIKIKGQVHRLQYGTSKPYIILYKHLLIKPIINCLVSWKCLMFRKLLGGSRKKKKSDLP